MSNVYNLLNKSSWNVYDMFDKSQIMNNVVGEK